MSFLIVAQGNPGLQYARTKHNVGFWVLDRLSSQFRSQANALLAPFSVAEETGWLMKPTTFYNATGEAVAPFARYYKIPPERILVVHDELDLPPGRLRFKGGGGNAGNYGLESISTHLSSKTFHRLRIGIGKPPNPEEGAGWVLSGFRPELLSVMEKVVGAAAEGVKTWAAEGLDAAQKRYNGLDFRPSKPAEA
jgi:PTH1 family peptidyl-tRNA hydrolase